MNNKYLTAKEVKEKYNIHITTLHRWSKEGIISPIRTPGGHRRYSENELSSLLGEDEIKTNITRCAIYARVSTKKQDENGNLKRQVNRLRKAISNSKGIVVAEHKEVASGLNENRRELNKLLALAKNDDIDKVFVEYKDRLARFGFRYLEQLFNAFNVEIVEIQDKEDSAVEEELVQDMISIVSSFSARLYGQRGGRVTKKIKKIIEGERL